MDRIGIIGAMENEVAQLKKDTKIIKEVTKAGMTFCEGVLNNRQVIIVQSGLGKVNAAVCAQILVDDFEVEAIINTGMAGALTDQTEIGDIVISTDTLHHDMDAVGFGYPLGQVPQMEVREFQANQKLIDLAKNVCEEVNPDIKVFCGRIVSGDQFVADADTKNKIVKNFGGLCTEMEGAAIAHTAYLNAVPFVIIRAISDKADCSTDEYSENFQTQAAEHCVRLVEGLLEKLAN